MKSIIKNLKFLLLPIVFLFNQDLNAQKTTVTCENKSDVNISIMLYKSSGAQDELKVKTKGSGSKELIGNDFLVGAEIAIEEKATAGGFTGYRVIGGAFKKDFEGKYATGPRTVKITITNDKITTTLTDSNGQNPETTTTDIKPPLK